MKQHHLFVLILSLSILAVRSEKFSLGSGTDRTFGSANLNTYLDASIVDNKLCLTTSNGTAGLALYPQQVTSHLGFTTRFNWTTSDCSTSIDPLATANYTDGVSFFITDALPSSTSVESGRQGMGLASIPIRLAIGYVTSLNEFHICNWNNPSIASPFFRQVCSIYPYSRPRLPCSTHSFTIVYDYFANTLVVTLNGVTVVSTQLPQPLSTAPGYIGIAAGVDNFPRQHDISLWAWESTNKAFEFTQATSPMTTIGSAYVEQSNRLLLTPNSTYTYSIAYLNESLVYVQQQFSTKFKWTLLNCDVTYGAGEGVTTVGILASYGAALGIVAQNNVTMIAYSRVANKFFVCNWTQFPYQGRFEDYCPTFNNPLPPFACSQSHIFEVNYMRGIVKIFMNGVFLFASAIQLDETNPYIIGISGSTGSSYATQYISDWSFNSTSWQPETVSPSCSSLAQLGAATSSCKVIENWPTSGPNTGGLVHRTAFPAHLGFTSQIKVSFVCNQFVNSPYDGFTFFLTSDPSSLQIQSLPYTDLGLKSLKNVLSVSFFLKTNRTAVCKWMNYENTVAADFRDATEYCTYLNIPAFNLCSKPWIPLGFNFGIQLSNQTLTLLGDSIVASLPMALYSSSYYIGVLGAEQSQAYQYLIRSWNLAYFAAVQNFKYFSFSLLNHTSYFASDTLTNNNQIIIPTGTPAALTMHKTPVLAHYGFNTSFSWSSNSCGATSSFSFFITKTRPTDVVKGSDDATGRLGTASLQSLVSISYSSAMNDFRVYFNTTLGNPYTYTSAKFSPNLFCQTQKVCIEYTFTNILNIFVNDQLLVSISDRTQTVINPAFYYVGLSGLAGNFTGWNYNAIAPTKRQNFGFSNSSELDLLGTASIVDNKLRLTTGGSESGVAMYPSTIYAHDGFASNLTWTPTNCDAANNGADGFTLFLTKTHPLNSEVYSSSGGSLGIGAVSNVVMFAYSATFNEFYVCNWTIPLGAQFRWICNYVIPAPGPKMTCPNTYTFSYSYDHQTFKLSVNGTQQFTASLMLEPVPYFVGLSGATGGGYFQQDVSDWSFESIAL